MKDGKAKALKVKLWEKVCDRQKLLTRYSIAKPLVNGYRTLHVIDIYSVPSNIVEIKHRHDVRSQDLDEVRPHMKYAQEVTNVTTCNI